MKIKSLILSLLIISTLPVRSSAQGCSDAGFCTLSNMKPEHNDSSNTFKNRFKIGYAIGKGDFNINIHTIALEYKHVFNQHWEADAKLTGLRSESKDYGLASLSDFFLTATYKTKNNFAFTAGTKLPFNRANVEYSPGRDLPMNIQTSLGTYDLILGVGKSFKKLQLNLAYQMPLVQNKNEFNPGSFGPTWDFYNYPITNQFQRANDVLLRVSYPFEIKRFNITPSVLPIYHLANDKYTLNNMQYEIEGSKGLTLNGVLFLDYKISDKKGIHFSAGQPFIVRKIRPDGLTRHYVFTLEYSYKF